MDIYRKIHFAASNWGLLLMAFHLGLHWKVILSRIRLKRKGTKFKGYCAKGITLAVVLYGVWAFTQRGVSDYLFLRTEYVFFDYFRTGYFLFIRLYGNYNAIRNDRIWHYMF